MLEKPQSACTSSHSEKEEKGKKKQTNRRTLKHTALTLATFLILTALHNLQSFRDKRFLLIFPCQYAAGTEAIIIMVAAYSLKQHSNQYLFLKSLWLQQRFLSLTNTPTNVCERSSVGSKRGFTYCTNR